MRYNYYPQYGYNPQQVLYQIIILILIVLQWMRTPSGGANDLTNNGGLFIITLFSIAACMCYGSLGLPSQYPYRRRCCRYW